MRLLMIYTDKFDYKTSEKNLEDVENYDENRQISDALVGFVHMEKKDEEDINKIETKLIKNMKWAARKNDTQTLVLHSFAHLAMSKADPKITKTLLDNAEKRLKSAGYQVQQTPFGYFLDLVLHAPGKSLARIFKEI